MREWLIVGLLEEPELEPEIDSRPPLASMIRSSFRWRISIICSAALGNAQIVHSLTGQMISLYKWEVFFNIYVPVRYEPSMPTSHAKWGSNLGAPLLQNEVD